MSSGLFINKRSDEPLALFVEIEVSAGLSDQQIRGLLRELREELKLLLDQRDAPGDIDPQFFCVCQSFEHFDDHLLQLAVDVLFNFAIDLFFHPLDFEHCVGERKQVDLHFEQIKIALLVGVRAQAVHRPVVALLIRGVIFYGNLTNLDDLVVFHVRQQELLLDFSVAVLAREEITQLPLAYHSCFDDVTLEFDSTVFEEIKGAA
mmetsp:Transcript_19441/g.22643  ORF Transcript_19441/g.22643 Transcript_19441/m.22643 type:complete len:205 (+) Transcript_19441:492-1106(+)